MCNNEFTGNYQALYCSDCKKLREKEYTRKQSERRSVKRRQKLKENMENLKLEGLDLLPNNFNEKSPLKFSNYTNSYRTNWYEILKMYDKFDSLKQALLLEYKKFYEETGWYGHELFLKYINTSQYLLKYIDFEEFRNSIGKTRIRKTDEELRDNFLDVVRKLGRLPYQLKDFTENSKIHINTYIRRINIEGDIVTSIVKEYIKNDEILHWYFKGKKFHKNISESNRIRRYVEAVSRDKDEIIESTRLVVDLYMKEYNKLPRACDLQDLTGISTNLIKEKFNMYYREFLHSLGYKVTKGRMYKGVSTEEKLLNNISQILDSDYISQMCFDWLNGTRGWKLKCDGYFKDYDLVVEYDGEQHFYPIDFAGKGEEHAYQEFLDTQMNDRIKNKQIPQHGLILLRIAYDEPINDTDYLKMKLLDIGLKIPNYTLVESNLTKSDIKAS